MAALAPAGPPAPPGWETRSVGRPYGHVLVAPDVSSPARAAAGLPPLHYYLPARPLVVVGPRGPALALTLLLDRQPAPEDESLEPSILRGLLSVDLTLEPPEGALAQLRAQLAGELRPLFAREVCYQLVSGATGEVLASAAASGSSARAACGATLSREATLAVLRALQGEETSLALRAGITYRAAAAERQLHLGGSWAAIHDYLRARAGDDGLLSLAAVRAAFADMLRDAVVRVSGGDTSDPARACFELFLRLAAVVLRRETAGLPPLDEGNTYTLRPRPHPALRLSCQQTVGGSTEASLELRAGLRELLGGLLDGHDWGTFVRAVCVDGAASEARPLRRRVTDRIERPGRWRRGEEPAAVPVAALGDVRSIAAALRSDTRSLAAPQRAVVAAPGAPGGPARTIFLDDLRLEPPGAAASRSLPVVADPDAGVWPDRVRRNLLWYAPTFVLDAPPNADPDTSPFRFEFEQVGTAFDPASGAARPALTGSVRFTLRAAMGPAVRQKLGRLRGLATWALPLSTLAVMLEVPFLDPADNSVKTNSFPAEVAQSGDTITATVRLVNDWLCLCYGALALPGFQPQPARLHISYSYEAYIPAELAPLKLVCGQKAELLPVAHSAAEARELSRSPHFDATAGAYRTPAAELQLRREELLPDLQPGPGAPGRTWDGLPRIEPAPLRPPPHAEELTLADAYAVRTLVRQERQDVCLPCAEYGAFYRERTRDGWRPVGCRPAFELHKAAVLALYEERADLAVPGLFRVFRATAQPHRFLILPARYRITRKDPAEPDAYRACVLVYLDLTQGGPEGQYIFQAELQPDVPPFARAELQRRLAQLAANPVVEYPTEVTGQVAYAGSLDGVMGAPSVVILPAAPGVPGSFLVTLCTSQSQAQVLLRILQAGGVALSAAFTLGDGTTLTSALQLHLAEVAGPWRGGPLAIAPIGGGVRLTNRVENTVAVSELRIYEPGGATRSVPVERELAAGATTDVPLVGAAGPVEAVFGLRPLVAGVGLPEVRIFNEGIVKNVVFANQVNYDNHQLAELKIEAKIADVEGEASATWSPDAKGCPPASAELRFVLPLTVYLGQPALLFRVGQRFRCGDERWTPWLCRDLRQSAVVSITWALLQGSQP